MSLAILFPIFLLGLAIGSFVNVLIYRTLTGESAFVGRSHCDSCLKKLSWYENVPLLSYVILKGRCRKCKKLIPRSYPLVELITGVLFVWWATLGFAFFQLSAAPLLYLQPMFWLFVGIFLVIVFFTDYLYGIIPNFAVAGLGVATLLYRGYLVFEGVMQQQDFVLALVAALVAFAVFLSLFLATRGKGLGFGDVKFAMVMAFLLGYPKAMVGFFLSFVIGGAVGSVLLLSGKKKLGQKVAFGPFLVLGLVVALIAGEQIWGWYLSILA